MAEKKEEPKVPKITTSKSTGLESNVAGALAYSLGIVSGILFLVVEKDDKFVRFHAMQSILANLALFVLPVVLFISIIGIIFLPFVGIFTLVIWILLMVKAYKGEMYKLPFLGDIAERQI